MSARTLVIIVAALISGCATVEEVEPKTPTTPTPTCKGAPDCEVKWSAARSYLISHASYKLQNDSVDRLETYNPSNEATVGLRAQVNKALQPDGSYAIVAKFWCNNLVVCSPNADATLSDFNRTVAAATSGEPLPPPVAVNQPPAATASLSDAERYIKDSEASWAESVSTNDASVVKRIMADDCVWILDGRMMDKDGAIAAAARGPGNLVSNHLDYATVRLFGDTAIVHGSDTWTRQDGKIGHFIWTDTWIRRNGQWQIVAAQDTVTPTK